MTKQSSETRNALRAKTLGRNNILRKKIIDYYPAVYREIKNDDGEVIGHEFLEDETYDAQKPVKVEVRQPTVRERNKLINSCQNEDGKLDTMEFILQAAIAFTYDPESGEKLFDKTDYNALSATPSGDFIDQFGGEAIKMLTLGEAKDRNSLKVSGQIDTSNQPS